MPPDKLAAFADDDELAPPLPEAGRGSLFDLDVPTIDDLAASRAGSSTGDREPHNTADLMIGNLDIPDSDPPEGRSADSLEVPVPPARSGDGPERRVSLPPPERARNAEEQHEQRRRRVIDRVLTLRDSFRLMSHLDVPETERKALGRQLVALDQELGVAAGMSVIKDPAQALQVASKEQLDTAERVISALEDKMLALDELVAPEVFQPRVEVRKQSKKSIARYGRLLVSKRMPAGQRRDRFEWIATHLLSGRAASGELVIMQPERARSVLQHLVGGLPRKLREQELEEALAYLNEAMERLDRMQSHEQLFESGLFLDFHGYKVSMREQLLSPEFVYLSVALNVKLHNKLEQWIAEREGMHDTNQLTSEGTPRQQIMRRLRSQEEEVEASFGVRRRSMSRLEAVRPESHRPQVQALIASEPPPRAVRRVDVAFDRSLIALVLAVLVAIGAGVSLLFSSGVIGKTEVVALDGKALERYSPLLIRGMLLGKGEARKLKAFTSSKKWEALDPRKRREVADELAKTLSVDNVRDADVLPLGGKEPVIVIERGTVTIVEGGRL